MKKYKNPENQIKNIIGDMESLFGLVKEINSTKIEDLNLKELSSKVNKFNKKYKDILPKESENNLDSEK